MICPYYAEFRLASWLSVFYYAKTQIGSITLQNAKVVGISNKKTGLKFAIARSDKFAVRKKDFMISLARNSVSNGEGSS